MSEESAKAALVKSPGDALEPATGGQQGISAPVSQGGVNHLAMNVVVPGLGSLVRGRRSLGLAQLGLAVAGVPMLFFVWWLGLLMMLGGWCWSVASGIGFVRQRSSLEW